MKDQDINDIDVIEEIKKANEELYELFGRLHEYDSFLKTPEKQNAVADNIFNAYMQNVELINLRYKWLYEREKYKLTVENSCLTPKRRRRWYWPFTTKPNASAEVIEQKAAIEFDKILAEQKAKVQEIYEEHMDSEPENPEPIDTLWTEWLNPPPAEPSQEILAEHMETSTTPENAATTEPDTAAPLSAELSPEQAPKPAKRRHKRGKKDEENIQEELALEADGSQSREYIETPFEGGAQITFNIKKD